MDPIIYAPVAGLRQACASAGGHQLPRDADVKEFTSVSSTSVLGFRAVLASPQSNLSHLP